MGKHFEDKKEQKQENQEVENNEIDVKLLNELKEKLEAQKAEINDKDERLKRLMAEFDNYKKRSAKEREGMYNSLVSDIAISILPVVDNLEKAVSVKTEDDNYKVGIELVLKQFKEVLKANGINEIDAIGKTFDPQLHEAISSVDDPELGSQEIKEEYRKGYMIGDKVIRHSLVVVAN